MNIEKTLKKIKDLEQQNKELQKSYDELEHSKKELESDYKELKYSKQELQEEFEVAQQIIYELNEKLNDLLKEYENLSEQRKIERIKVFVPKTEVFNPVVINETEEIIKEKKEKTPRKRRAKNFSNFNFEAHVSEVKYERPEESECSTCGGALSLASEKVRYVVESIPATLKVTKIIKQSCKCNKCNKADKKLYYPLSTSLFPGSIMSHSFVSYIAYHKYDLGIPFHRLSGHIKEVIGIDISKQNLANYMAKLANILKPVYEHMKDDLLNNSAKVIHADETTLVVSKRPIKDINRKKSYVYVYTSSFYDNQIAIYDFHETRAIDKTAKWLENYSGVIVCDDFRGYTKLKKLNSNIKLQRCFSHVRRRFMDIVKSLPEVKRTTSQATKILNIIGELFHFESTYKKEKLLISEIKVRRNTDHPLLIKKLEDLIFNHTYKPNSAIEKAVKYTKGVWKDLFTYLDSGYLEISNNIAERAVRPFVINRKVFMTSGSYAGARYTTIIFSIIRTAKLNNLQVSKYLEYVLDNIQTKEIKDLLPYNKNIPKTLINI